MGLDRRPLLRILPARSWMFLGHSLMCVPGSSPFLSLAQSRQMLPWLPKTGIQLSLFPNNKNYSQRIVILLPQVFIMSPILPTPWPADTCKAGIPSSLVSDEEMGAREGAETSPRSQSPEAAEEGLELMPSCPRALTICHLLAGTPLQGRHLGEEEPRGFLMLDGACSPADAKPHGPVIHWLTFHPGCVSPKSVPRTPGAEAACQAAIPSPCCLLPSPQMPQSKAATFKQGTPKG